MICEDILCFVSNECFLSDVLLFVFCGILRLLEISSPAFLLCVWLILFLRYSPEEQLPCPFLVSLELRTYIDTSRREIPKGVCCEEKKLIVVHNMSEVSRFSPKKYF